MRRSLLNCDSSGTSINGNNKFATRDTETLCNFDGVDRHFFDSTLRAFDSESLPWSGFDRCLHAQGYFASTEQARQEPEV